MFIGRVTAVIIVLCCIQYSSQVELSPLQKLFRGHNNLGWDYIATNNTLKKRVSGGGRGPIQYDILPGRLPTYNKEDFAQDAKCIDSCCDDKQDTEFYADICFAVQMSCYLNASETFLKARGQMADIIDQIGKDLNGTNNVEFTVFLYSDKVDEWQQRWGPASTGRKAALRNMHIEKRNCDCESRTHDAITACTDEFKARQVNGINVPRTIIVFTDGITQHDVHAFPAQARLQTIATLDATYNNFNIVPKVVPYPPGRPDAVRIIDGSSNPNIFSPNEGESYKNQESCVGGACFDVESFPSLNLRVPILVQQDQPDCACCMSDVVMVIDRSNSINKDDLHLMFHFVHDFIKKLEGVIHPECGARFGVLSYCGRVQLHINLKENLTKHELLNKLAKVNTKQRCMYTETPKAIEAATKQLVTDGRENARKVIILATDGRTWLYRARKVLDPPTLTINKTQDAKDAGIDMFVIGLPNHRDRNDGYEREWQFIGSSPVNCSVVDMQEKPDNKPSYKDLDTARVYMNHKVCCLDFATQCTDIQDPLTGHFCGECQDAFCPAPGQP